ncbi:MAG: phosphatidylserine/phosphatidylglycerophosphate/cardiolipin synthase family protein [Candidatus Roizmanbacteria bacterium]
MSQFNIQEPTEFLQDFIMLTQKAKKRIWVQTMNFDPGPHIDVCVASLINAARRGVDVRINVDWIAERFYDGRFDTFPTLNTQRRSALATFNITRQTMYRSLASAGVALVVTNKPNLFGGYFPAYRRNHIKMFMIDDDVVWVGGVNLMEHALHNFDLMVRVTDQTIIRALADQFPQVNVERPKHDYQVECTKDTTFLVDSGRKMKSLIYNEAIKSIGHARKNITFISQFLPGGQLLSQLIRISREKNVHVTIVTSHRDDEFFNAFPHQLAYKHFLLQIRSCPGIRLIHFHRKVHVKLLLVDDEEALFGSHNFWYLGGLFGTEEIAFHTGDKKLINDLRNFVRKILNDKSLTI